MMRVNRKGSGEEGKDENCEKMELRGENAFTDILFFNLKLQEAYPSDFTLSDIRSGIL